MQAKLSHIQLFIFILNAVYDEHSTYIMLYMVLHISFNTKRLVLLRFCSIDSEKAINVLNNV